MARGGRRAGVQGRQYPNRADLATNARPLPVTAVPGQPYGVAGQQAAAQRAVPMAPASPSPVPPGTQSSQPPERVAPGSLGAFDRPTDRPNEPITAGVGVGPGPGPEVMPTAQSMADLLSQLAASTRDPGIAQLAARAQQLGQ